MINFLYDRGAFSANISGMMLCPFPRLMRCGAVGVSMAVVYFCLSPNLNAELIPASRMTTWTPGTYTGVPGGIPARPRLMDVTLAPYSADSTGVKDAHDAIAAAISAASSNDVVYLPAGKYRINSKLALNTKSYITLRGAGTNTVLDMRTTDPAIYCGSGSDYQWNWPPGGNSVTAGLTKGSTSITIADTSAFSAGDMVNILFLNDTNVPVINVNGENYSRKQMTRVVGKDSTHLFIFPGIYGNYGGPGAKVSIAQLTAKFVGIEDMTIELTNSTASFGIWMEQAYGCWIKNVRTKNAYNYHVYFNDCLQCEMRECWLDKEASVGANHAAFLVDNGSGLLVENNIFDKAQTLMEINQGSAGCVFAYNYLHDSILSLDSNHGAHNCFNLYEGNVSPNFEADGYFGSVSDDTLFRNFFTGEGTGWCITLKRFTRNYSIIGNVLSTIPYYGQPNIGNGGNNGSIAPPWADWGTGPGPSGFQEFDSGVAATAIAKGNKYLDGAVTEPLGGDTMPDSLYRTSKPAWFGTNRWPAFGSDLSPTYVSIPAQVRYAGVQVASIDQSVPTVPASLIAVASSPSQVNLSWAASTDDQGIGGYLVERSKDTSSPGFAQVSLSTDTQFSDGGLSPATSYSYRIRAVNLAGTMSDYSSVAAATTPATPDLTAPTIPTSILVQALGANQLTITWSASTDNVGVMSYSVERSLGADSSNFIQVGEPIEASFVDNSLSPSTTYSYRVRAVDAAGNWSDYSDVITATITSPPSSDDLVAAYNFNENSGATVFDSSGKGNNGTISGATRVGQGRFGKALSFNGVDNMVIVNGSTSLNASSSLTIESWIYPTAILTNWHAVMHRQPDAYYLHVSSPSGAMRPAGGAKFNGQEQYVSSPLAITTNSWTHLATTYDGNMLRVYVNGVETGHSAMSGNIETNSNPLMIGGNTYPGQYFKGLIDEIRIYRRALTQTEIQMDMNTPVGTPSVPPPVNLRVVSSTP